LGLSHEQEFIVTTPGGVVIPGNFCDWTIGDYKKRKRLSGQLSVALCQKDDVNESAMYAVKTLKGKASSNVRNS
jgi:hypothetical protein